MKHTMPKTNGGTRPSEYRKHDAFDWVQLIFVILTFIAVSVYTVISGKQLVTVRDGNKINHDAYVAAYRAFVVSNRIGARLVGNNWIVWPIWENSGSSPTKEMTMYANYCTRTNPLPENFGFPDLPGRKSVAVILGPHQPIAGEPWPIPVQAFSLIQNRVFRYYTYGWTRYRDIIADAIPHITEYCFEITGTEGDPAVATSGINFTVCDIGHNCADDEAPASRPNVSL
jgi:hypothetical protein